MTGRPYVTSYEWQRAATLLLAIQREVAGVIRPYDSDSHLPPHLVAELDAVVAMCGPMPGRAITAAPALQMGEVVP